MKKYSIKQILMSNGNWWRFYEANKSKIRASILICITKLLSCRHLVRGYHHYRCENPSCNHVKRVAHTCKCKACFSCGKKATELWIAKQNGILPNTEWQHITFTMPDVFWDFFWLNRHLLNEVGKIAAHAILTIAKTKKVTPAIFIAIHTFGRDLKRNVHIHLSTTRSGITADLLEWRKLYFDETTLMRIWRYEIIKLFRKHHKNNSLILPASIQKTFNPINTFTKLLDRQYKRRWIVDCSKATENYNHTVNYLGRYVKRPPIAESKLRHYDGNDVTFTYRDHNTKTYRNLTTSVDDFITRFIQHIPDVGFRMIRYYGTLANRVRGKLLPIIYALLGQQQPCLNPKISFAALMKTTFNIDPFKCVLCKAKMILDLVIYGKSSTAELLSIHRELALLKKI